MSPDQEKLLREWAYAEPMSGQVLPSYEPVAIRALAQVVLELVELTDVLSYPQPVAVHRRESRPPQPHSLRLQMEHAVEDLRHLHPSLIVDNLLGILEQDPGETVARKAREHAREGLWLGAYRAVIKAIRRGE